MTPNGLNPFGLEERTLTFHHFVNNVEQGTFTCKNRLYCYASFPSEMIALSSEWATTSASDEATWNTLAKYKTKESPDGTKFMVMGDQHFYFCQFVSIWVTYDTRLDQTYFYNSFGSSWPQSKFIRTKTDSVPSVIWPNAQMSVANRYSDIVSWYWYQSECTWWDSDNNRKPADISGLTESKTYYAHWKFTLSYDPDINNADICASIGGLSFTTIFGFVPPGNYTLNITGLLTQHEGGQTHHVCIGFAYSNPLVFGGWSYDGEYNFSISNLSGTDVRTGTQLPIYTDSMYGPLVKIVPGNRANITCDVGMNTTPGSGHANNLWMFTKVVKSDGTFVASNDCSGMEIKSQGQLVLTDKYF